MTNPLYNKLYALVETDQVPDHEDIANALQSGDFFVQWIGCKAAGLSRDPKWVNRLEELATAKIIGGDPDVNSIAIWALAKIGGLTVDKIWRSASVDPLSARRRMAADLIGEMQAVGGIDALDRLLIDDDPEVANWASLSAAKLGQPGFNLVSQQLERTQDRRRFLYFADALLKVDRDAGRAAISNALRTKSDDERRSLERAVLQLTKITARM